MMDNNFDRMIQDELNGLSYEKLETHNPYSHYIGILVAGLFMALVVFNVSFLGLIGPVVGFVLLSIAIQPLHKADKYFTVAFAIIVFSLTVHLAVAVIAATIYGSEIIAHLSFLPYLLTGLKAVMLWCLGKGFNRLRALSVTKPSYIFYYLCLWQLLVIILGMISYQGYLVYVIILSAGFLVYKVRDLVNEIRQAAYETSMVSPLIDHRIYICIITVLLIGGITVGNLFFTRYPMDWTAMESNQQIETLKEKDFYEDMLRIMAPEDLKTLEKAVNIRTTEYGDRNIISHGYKFETSDDEAYFLCSIKWVNDFKAIPDNSALVYYYIFNQDGTDSEEKPDIVDSNFTIVCEKDGKLIRAKAPLASSQFISPPSFFGMKNPDPLHIYDFSFPKDGTDCQAYYLIHFRQKEGLVYDLFINLINGYNNYPFHSGLKAYENGLRNYDMNSITFALWD